MDDLYENMKKKYEQIIDTNHFSFIFYLCHLFDEKVKGGF